MPVRNVDLYLLDAIKSMLSQSLADFELIIIDDASTDKTPKILRLQKDRRIRIVRNRKRQGVAKSLNTGLKLARGEYIARMDGDDIALLNRLEIQTKYLRKHPNVALVGSCAWIIDKGKKIVDSIKYPTHDYQIKRQLFKRNVIIHPTVVFRRRIIERYGLFDETLDGAEDYDFWLRIASSEIMHNLPKYLLYWRRSINSRSYQELTRIQRKSLQARLKAIRSYGYPKLNYLRLLPDLLSFFVPKPVKLILYDKVFHYS